jgi:Domain of unknown function (DUF4126)
MEAFLTGLGLSAPAGLNAYIPLLTLGLADRYTGLIDLSGSYDALSSDAGLAILTVLLVIEVVVDKIAGADHVNDAIQTVIRPAAGAYVMLASTDDELAPALDVLFGGGLAGGVHSVKAAARGLVTVSTLGLGNPVISAIEDGIAFVSSLVAVAVPLLVILVLPGLVVLAVWAMRNVPSRNGP